MQCWLGAGNREGVTAGMEGWGKGVGPSKCKKRNETLTSGPCRISNGTRCGHTASVVGSSGEGVAHTQVSGARGAQRVGCAEGEGCRGQGGWTHRVRSRDVWGAES